MPTYNKDTVLGVCIAAVTASALTYIITKKITEEEDDFVPLRKRSVVISKADAASLQKLAKEKSEDKPKGTKLPISIDDVYLLEVENLENYHKSEGEGIVNAMHGVNSSLPIPDNRSTFWKQESAVGSEAGSDKTAYNKLIGTYECILKDLIRKPGGKLSSVAYVRAGPRKNLFFNPQKVNAAIVTCGGLCPGLNNVIREITNSLYNLYGTEGKVFGIRGGYRGFHDPEYPPVMLTPEVVNAIHHKGGTFLGSSRGGFDLDKIIAFINKNKIQQLYVIGGDGTHRGAFRIHEGCLAAGLKVSVAGIPKTIDNDVAFIDRSFGFSTSVEASQAAIRAAKVEAECNMPNGIGIVKVMGRSAGFIAVHATMGSGDVDLCLVPEVPIVLDGPSGCLPHLLRTVKRKGSAVVVVAEGAGEELLGTSAETDASGNKILPKIGTFMKSEVEKYFQSQGEVATVKYIDPSYMIRSVPANATDSLYCMQLAQNAVHGAMAGFTGFSVGLCNNKMVFIPIPDLCADSPRIMNPRGRTWERVLALTLQPNTVPPELLPGEKPYDSEAPMLR